VATRIRLQRSITLAVLLIGLFSGTLGLGYAYWHAKETRRTTAGLYFRELARQSADKVSLVLAKEVEWVERLGGLSEVREAVREGMPLDLDKPELQRWREAQRQYFRSIAIVDRQGTLVGGITSETTRTHYTQQSWWTVVFEQGRPWAGDLLVDEQGKGYWEVAVPIMADDGHARGALKVAIGIDQLFASILRARIGRTGHVMVMETDGRVLICPLLPPGRHTRTDGVGGGRSDVLTSAGGAIWAEVQDDGHGLQGGLVGIAPVVLPSPIVQERIWQILVRQDPQEIYEPARTLTWKLAAFWVGAFGLIALFGTRLAQRIVRPIERLVVHVQSLGNDQPIEKTKMFGGMPNIGIVEIEALAESFERLGERLERASLETQRYVGELEAANQELARSEEHYRTLWNHAVDTKLIVDSNGLVQDANRRAELKLGRRAEELIGLQVADLLADPDRERFHKLLVQVVQTGKEAGGGEVLVSSAHGAVLTMEPDLVPIEQAGKQAVLLQLSDVTEKKLLEQQLLRSERLASLSQFASMFAHDIRNPLAGIKKTLEVLGHRQELQADPVNRWFSDLQFTTDLLLGMINDMLDVYQESYSGLPLVSSTFSVGVLLQEVVHLFRSEAEAKGVTINLNLPANDVMLEADRRRLLRVGINLVHNALKYSPAGGRITLSACLRQTEASDVPPPEGSGTNVLVMRVEDEGPGVAKEDLPHLFELFFRKKDGHDLRIGRGLGLYFCRLVVEAHGGRIQAANQTTGGAVFSLFLPLRVRGLCPSSS